MAMIVDRGAPPAMTTMTTTGIILRGEMQEIIMTAEEKLMQSLSDHAIDADVMRAEFIL